MSDWRNEAILAVARYSAEKQRGMEATATMIDEGTNAIIGHYADFVTASNNPKDIETVRKVRIEAERCYRAMQAAAPLWVDK